MSESTVGFHSTVSFTDEHGAEKTFRIVAKHEAAPADGLLSDSSPVAQALIGRNVGERVEVHTPKGVRPLFITAVAA
jgi:transcription elongation factor GreA